MNQTIEGVHWTVYDLEVLPENEWTRYEIIDRRYRLDSRVSKKLMEKASAFH